MVPGNTLQTEQRGSGTEADDGLAFVQGVHQSNLSRRIELDSDDG